MADEVDSLILEASVLDDFSKELDELEESLLEIQAVEDATNPVDIDARIASALAKVNTIESRLAAMRDEYTIDVDVDDDNVGFVDGLFAPRPSSEGIDFSDRKRISDTFADEERMWELFGIQAGKGLWQDNPFVPEEAGTLFSPGESPSSGRGELGEGDMRELIFGQREPLSGDLLPGEERGGFPLMESANRSRFDPLREAISDFKNLRLSMGLFMNILASLIPLIGVFVGALPAAIAGVGALAGAALAAATALGGIVGLGLLGMATTGGEFNFDALRNKIQSLIDSFLSAFSSLGDSFAPLMEDAFVTMEMVLFDVAMRMRQLLSLTDSARKAMNSLAGLIGPVLEDTALFAEAAMPAIFQMAGTLSEIDIFSVMADILAETLPLLVFMASVIGRTLPAIYELSRGFLAVAAGLTALFGGMFQLLNVVPFLAEGFGILIGLTFTAISASALYSLAMSTVATRVLAVAAGIFKAFIPSLYNAIAAEYGAVTATIALASATALLLGILTFGLAPMLGTISSQFNILGNDITTATDELRNFNRVSRRTSMPAGARGFGNNGSGPRYSKPTSATSNNSSSIQNTVVASDKETGNAIANTLGFVQRGSSKTDGTQVSDRHHGL